MTKLTVNGVTIDIPKEDEPKAILTYGAYQCSAVSPPSTDMGDFKLYCERKAMRIRALCDERAGAKDELAKMRFAREDIAEQIASVVAFAERSPLKCEDDAAVDESVLIAERLAQRYTKLAQDLRFFVIEARAAEATLETVNVTLAELKASAEALE